MKRNDLIGRCLAEARDPLNVQCVAVDFTYADDANTGESPEGALVLMYSHMDAAFHKMRDAGRTRGEDGQRKRRRVRFLCAGEHGSAKGRAHWHAVLFVAGEPLRLPPERSRVNWEMWPHGFSYIKPADYRTILYAVKYALKPVDQRAAYGYAKKANYSRYPPLGSAYFDALVDQHVEQRIPVHDNMYRFRDVVDRKGRPRQFYLRGRSLERFLRRYVERWHAVHGGLPPLTDFVVENYLDRMAELERRDDPAEFEKSLARKVRRDPLEASLPRVSVPLPAAEPILSRRHVGTFLLAEQREGEGGVAVAYSDGAVSVRWGSAEPRLVNARSADALAEVDRAVPGLLDRRELASWIADKVRPRLDAPHARYVDFNLGGEDDAEAV